MTKFSELQEKYDRMQPPEYWRDDDPEEANDDVCSECGATSDRCRNSKIACCPDCTHTYGSFGTTSTNGVTVKG